MSYYQYHIFFCLNERNNGEACCHSKGAIALFDYAKKRIKELKLNGPGQVRVNRAGCLNRCEEGAAIVVYPEGIWYTAVDNEDIEEILQNHILKQQVVTRLRLPDSASAS